MEVNIVMTTEQKLKDRCTPEFIKWMCELAEGYFYNTNFNEIEYRNGRDKQYSAIMSEPVKSLVYMFNIFPLLIHRAVEGWNKKTRRFQCINLFQRMISLIKGDGVPEVLYEFKNYQQQSLTQAECAMLDCLLDIFEEEKK